jgi:hypothetical protein
MDGYFVLKCLRPTSAIGELNHRASSLLKKAGAEGADIWLP